MIFSLSFWFLRQVPGLLMEGAGDRVMTETRFTLDGIVDLVVGRDLTWHQNGGIFIADWANRLALPHR
jgi:hypothetical protein